MAMCGSMDPRETTERCSQGRKTKEGSPAKANPSVFSVHLFLPEEVSLRAAKASTNGRVKRHHIGSAR